MTATQRVEQRPELVWFCVLLVLGTSVPLSLLRPLLGLGRWTWLRVSPGLGSPLRLLPLRLLLPLGVWGPRPGRVEAGDAELRQVSDPPLVELESLSLKLVPQSGETSRTTNLGDVHVSWKVVLSNPGHVLPRPDVDLGDTVRRILVEDDGEVPRVDTPAHVLFKWPLCTVYSYVKIIKIRFKGKAGII